MDSCRDLSFQIYHQGCWLEGLLYFCFLIFEIVYFNKTTKKRFISLLGKQQKSDIYRFHGRFIEKLFQKSKNKI